MTATRAQLGVWALLKAATPINNRAAGCSLLASACLVVGCLQGGFPAVCTHAGLCCSLWQHRFCVLPSHSRGWRLRRNACCVVS
jgi:hypothetical protein